MSGLALFSLGFASGIVALLFGLSWMCWAAFKPQPKKQRVAMNAGGAAVLTEYGKEELIRAIRDDLKRRAS